MYLRVTPGSYDTAREADVQRLVDEQLVPAVRQLPGFRSYDGGLDRDHPGRLVGVTLWDQKAQAQGLRDAVRNLVNQLEALGVRLEPAQLYEVTAHA